MIELRPVEKYFQVSEVFYDSPARLPAAKKNTLCEYGPDLKHHAGFFVGSDLFIFLRENGAGARLWFNPIKDQFSLRRAGTVADSWINLFQQYFLA